MSGRERKLAEGGERVSWWVDWAGQSESLVAGVVEETSVGRLPVVASSLLTEEMDVVGLGGWNRLQCSPGQGCKRMRRHCGCP